MRFSSLGVAIIALIIGTNCQAMDQGKVPPEAQPAELALNKVQMVYEAALKDPKYAVNWSVFDPNNPADVTEAGKVARKLEVKFSRTVTALENAKGLVSNQTNESETVAYQTLDALHKQYTAFQQQTSAAAALIIGAGCPVMDQKELSSESQLEELSSKAQPEKLAPNAQMVYEAALKDPKYKVDWSTHKAEGFTNTSETHKVVEKLEVKFSQLRIKLNDAKICVSNHQINTTEKEARQKLEVLYKQYGAFQQQTYDDWAHIFMG